MNVEWEEDTLDRLADIYTAADPADRDAIAVGVEQINAQLATDPWNLGESREPGRRVWFAHPLVVVFSLLPGGGVVVYHVARLKGRPPTG